MYFLGSDRPMVSHSRLGTFLVPGGAQPLTSLKRDESIVDVRMATKAGWNYARPSACCPSFCLSPGGRTVGAGLRCSISLAKLLDPRALSPKAPWTSNASLPSHGGRPGSVGSPSQVLSFKPRRASEDPKA